MDIDLRQVNGKLTGGSVSLRPNREAASQTATRRADAAEGTAPATQSILTKVQATLANVPEVDSEQVAAVRNQLASGNYQVDNRQLAARLMSLDQQLPEFGHGGE